jgi:hypothetical protein
LVLWAAGCAQDVRDLVPDDIRDDVDVAIQTAVAWTQCAAADNVDYADAVYYAADAAAYAVAADAAYYAADAAGAATAAAARAADAATFSFARRRAAARAAADAAYYAADAAAGTPHATEQLQDLAAAMP